MSDLNLYFVVFAKKNDREWSCHAGYIFAKDRKDVEPLMTTKYGTEVRIRSCEKVEVKEGTILYGERWLSF